MNLEKIKAVAQTVRALSLDSINRSSSGHPGLPLGCADIGAVLYGEILKINPEESNWINRDRFVLSAGHGSMLLYSLLHLSGYKLSIKDLKEFRQINSKTPGHPEYGHTDGVEATTGPLGAGISNCVGMAIGETILADKFNCEEYKIIDHYTYGLVGDGCLMEGISYEAASLAGHLGLGKLILLFDSNGITIEGNTSVATSEDILKRFESFGWQTLKGDGHNIEEIKSLIEEGKRDRERPTIIEFKTLIGYGSPNRAGTSSVHGSPLKGEELNLTKKELGIPVDSDFYINPLAEEHFNKRKVYWKNQYDKWKECFNRWSARFPEKRVQWDNFFCVEEQLKSITPPEFKVGDTIASRKSGEIVLNHFANCIPSLVGGSADLTPSTNTGLKSMGSYSKDNRSGRNINFGIREHAMGGITNGLGLYGFTPFSSTFLVFSDYMRPTIRLAALMGIGSIFILTHDSIFVGEDGPTHQPIEHIESLRAIPGLTLYRPCDAQEVFEAYRLALENRKGPSVIILTRQNLPNLSKPEGWIDDFRKGGYIVKRGGDKPDTVIIATGSEVSMALEAADRSEKNIRVVSISSRRLFMSQTRDFRERVIPGGVRVVAVEAGITTGWYSFVRDEKDIIGIDSFGHSGKADDVAKIMDFTVDRILKRL